MINRPVLGLIWERRLDVSVNIAMATIVYKSRDRVHRGRACPAVFYEDIYFGGQEFELIIGSRTMERNYSKGSLGHRKSS